jgi:membrane associated rhomboid family serine protease
MNMHYRNPVEDAKYFLKRNKTFTRVILINIAVFLTVNIINVFLRLSKVYGPGELSPVIEWLSVPASLSSLIQKPWTIITYMFLQYDFFHLFFNMLILYFGGRIFLEYMNQKKFLSTYIWGGIMGALLYIAIFNIFPLLQEGLSQSIALGASASVLAVLIAISTYVPEYTVNLFLFGRTKLKYIALVVILIDILSIFTVNTRDPGEINFGGHIAHLGGALWGFMSIKLLRKGYDLSGVLDFFKFSGFKKYFMKSGHNKKKNKNPLNKKPISDDEYNLRKQKMQKKTDAILEKISKSGYESLSKEEKEFLFRMSNKN